MATQKTQFSDPGQELKALTAKYVSHSKKAAKAANAYLKSGRNKTPDDHYYEDFVAENKAADECSSQIKRIEKLLR